MTNVAATTSEKGGSGKSTCTLNLAGVSAAAGERTLIIDADPQASITRALGIDVADADTLAARLAQPSVGLTGATVALDLFLDILPGDRAIEATAAALAAHPDGPRQLALLLESVEGRYKRVIIDTPGYLGPITYLVWGIADVIIVPTRVGGQGDLAALVTTMDRLERAREAGLTNARHLVVPSNYAANEASQRYGLAAIQERYGTDVAEPIPHSALVERALNAGQTLASYRPHHPAARAFQSLSRRLWAPGLGQP